MNQQADMREIVLLATYPNGIPTSDYAKAVRIIESITMATLAGVPSGAARAPTHAVSQRAPATKRRMGTTKSIILEALTTGPKTSNELMELTGLQANASVWSACRNVGAINVNQAWQLEKPARRPRLRSLPGGKTIKEKLEEALRGGSKTAQELAGGIGAKLTSTKAILRKMGAKRLPNGTYELQAAG